MRGWKGKEKIEAWARETNLCPAAVDQRASWQYRDHMSGWEVGGMCRKHTPYRTRSTFPCPT